MSGELAIEALEFRHSHGHWPSFKSANSFEAAVLLISGFRVDSEQQARASNAPKPKAADALIDWTRPAMYSSLLSWRTFFFKFFFCWSQRNLQPMARTQ